MSGALWILRTSQGRGARPPSAGVERFSE